MTVSRPDLSDAGTAFAIGALVGVGLVLLLSSDSADGPSNAIRFLRDGGVPSRPASRRQVRELRRVMACVRRINEVESS